MVFSTVSLGFLKATFSREPLASVSCRIYKLNETLWVTSLGCDRNFFLSLPAAKQSPRLRQKISRAGEHTPLCVPREKRELSSEIPGVERAQV